MTSDTVAAAMRERLEIYKARDAQVLAERAVMFQRQSYFGAALLFTENEDNITIQRVRHGGPGDLLRDRVGNAVPIPLEDLPAVIAKLQSLLPPSPDSFSTVASYMQHRFSNIKNGHVVTIKHSDEGGDYHLSRPGRPGESSDFPMETDPADILSEILGDLEIATLADCRIIRIP